MDDARRADLRSRIHHSVEAATELRDRVTEPDLKYRLTLVVRQIADVEVFFLNRLADPPEAEDAWLAAAERALQARLAELETYRESAAKAAADGVPDEGIR
jgi:type I site-specific restriction endonuclease